MDIERQAGFERCRVAFKDESRTDGYGDDAALRGLKANNTNVRITK